MKFESESNNLKKSSKKPFESNIGKEEKLRTYFLFILFVDSLRDKKRN